jgi:hypothetical protein
MNKYTIITFSVLTGLLLFAIPLFDFNFQWWYLPIIYFISRYNGKVQQSTKQGFNIANIAFLKGKNVSDLNRINNLKEDSKPVYFLDCDEDLQQWFEVEVVTDFKGTIKRLRGCFSNGFELSENDLRMSLNKNAKHADIIKSVENNDIVIEYYDHGDTDLMGNNLEVVFTAILK